MTQLADDFLIYFFLLGQSSYDPRVPSSTISDRNSIAANVKIYYPSLCYLCITCAASVYSFHGVSMKTVSLNNSIYSIFIGCATLTCLLVLRRTPILGDQTSTSQLWQAFVRFEIFARQRLKLKMTFDRFAASYRCKVNTSLIFFGIMVFSKITHRLFFHGNDRINWIRHWASMTLIFGTILIIYQILFYVHLLADILKFLNQRLISDFHGFTVGTTIERNQKLATALRNYKRVHFRIWQISRLISDRYGWILVSLMTENINNTVQPIYRFIVELYEKQHLMSEFFSCLFIFFLLF